MIRLEKADQGARPEYGTKLDDFTIYLDMGHDLYGLFSISR